MKPSDFRVLLLLLADGSGLATVAADDLLWAGGMSALSSGIITAISDLRVVSLIRAAIAANLKGKPGPLGTVVRPQPLWPVSFGGVGSSGGEVDYAPRRVLEPEPRILPRRVIAPPPLVLPAEHLTVGPVPLTEVCPGGRTGPLPPPWKQPIWLTTVERQVVVKRIPPKPDIQSKGIGIDVFA